MIFLKLAPLLLVLLLSSNLWAASIGHMGRVVDASGTPLSGTANLQFEVHYSNDLTSTGVLCRKRMSDVPLSNGIYHVNLDFSSALEVPCDLNDVLKNTPAAQSVVLRVQETNLGLTFDWQNILHVPAALRSEYAAIAETIPDAIVTAQKINQMGASANQVLTWTGTAWAPVNIPPGNAGTVTSVGAGDGLSSGGTAADPVLNVNVDGTTMEIATDTLQVKDLGITTAKLSANAVTPAKMGLNTNQFDPLAPVLSLILDPNGAIGSGISGLGILTNPSFLEITSNQLSLANSGVTPGTYTSLTVDAKGRVTSAGSVSSSDLPFIESLETACANGEIYVANTGLVSCQRHLDFIRIGSATNYVELRVPGAHTGTSVLTFPSTGGAANQVLTTDGTGILSWQSPATSATPSGAAGGELTGTYPNPTIAAGAVTYAKTNFADGDIPQAKVNGLTTSLSGKENTITAGTTAQYWRGDKSWQTLDTTAVSEGTNLYYTSARARADAVVDAIVDGVLNIAPSQNAVFDALATKADSSSLSNYVAISGSNMTGPLGLNAQNEVQFRDADSSNYVALRAPTSVAANLVLNLPGSDGSAGQVLSTDGAGNLSWSSSGAGSVTNVTASLPLSSSGGTTPNLSIAQANSTTSGFLSSTDWNTFNNKEPAVSAGTTAQYRRGDKTWQTLNTTAVPEGTNLYYTTARTRADAVADAIVDGILNVAPSQNAVADALALKADASSLSNYVLKAGDTMTGALNLPANGLAVGTNQLVTTGGNVGIGTATPFARFNIATPQSSSDVNIRQTNGSSNSDLVDLAGSTGDAYLDHIVSATYTASSPTTIDKAVTLKIDGAPNISGTNLTTGDALAFWVQNDNSSFGGNVGVGTTAPGTNYTSAKVLHVKSTGRSSMVIEGADDNYATLVLSAGAQDSADEWHLNTYGTAGDKNLHFWNGGNKVTFSQSGNVGIGTTSPSSTLDVGGSSNSAHIQNLATWGLNARTQGLIIMPEGDVTDDGAGNLTIGNLIIMNPLAGSWIRINSGTYALGGWGSLWAPIPPSGARGTYVTPTVLPWLDADRNYDGRDRVLLAQRMSNGRIWTRFGVPANLTGTGNSYFLGSVGIGTTAPAYKLHVNGSVAGVGAYNQLSDIKFKKNITPLDNALLKLSQLTGYTYDWKQEEFKEKDFSDKKQLGLIAQEVEQVFPEAVSISKDGTRSVAYSMLIAPIIESIKSLFKSSDENSREIASLREENEELKRQNQLILERLNKLEAAQNE